MNTTEPSPVVEDELPLVKACAEVVRFRQHLLEIRANLPGPGYHMDLDPEAARTTSECLRRIPERAADLLEKLEHFRAARRYEGLGGCIDFLTALIENPGRLFLPGTNDFGKRLERWEARYRAVIARFNHPLKETENHED